MSQSERMEIEATVRIIEDALREDQVQRDAVDQRIREKTATLEFWRRRLLALEENSDGAPKRKRLPKGEPRRIVSEVIKATPGMSMSAIAQRTSLKWSTVRAALTRAPEIFEERDGGWYLKAT